MATRPVFHPGTPNTCLAVEVEVHFTWHKGMATSQKQKNVSELHAAAAASGMKPLLEVSTRSEDELGRRLSAFSLKVEIEGRNVPFECVYQGSKVFDRGGPFLDLYFVEPREAKADPRLKDSGRLIAFEFGGERYSPEPLTAFYDWLYIHTLYPHREFLRRLTHYEGFTDIAFNPERSISTQARSCATFVALQCAGLLDDAAHSFSDFVEILRQQTCEPSERSLVQSYLFEP